MIEYDYITFPSGKTKKYLPDRKFNRKTFDPIGNETDAAILKALRNLGRGRFFHGWASPSLRYLLEAAMWKRQNAGEAYIDFGCGESADRFIVAKYGYQGFGMDLFPPLFVEQDTGAFIKGDIAEPLPFADHTFTYATCHAVIALLKPEERAPFYREAYRCMKIGGRFVLCGQHLKNGYGFDLETERMRLLESTEFEYVRSIGYGVVVERN